MVGFMVALMSLAAGILWTSPLKTRPMPGSLTGSAAPAPGLREVPLMLDLVAVMLEAGAPVSRALGTLADSCNRPLAEGIARVRAALDLGLDWDAAWDAVVDAKNGAPPEGLTELRRALHFAVATGAPSAALIYARSTQLRRTQHRNAEKRAAALGVQLVLPLGLCALPAFICLGIAPVVLAMVPDLALP